MMRIEEAESAMTKLHRRRMLAGSAALSIQTMTAQADEKNSTMQPFVKGDVFVGATLLNNPADDHAGVGRIIQYDANLKEKGVLWVNGTTHLVGGLTFAPDGTLRLDAQVAQVPARAKEVADARALGPPAIGRDPFTLHDADEVPTERIDQVDHRARDGRREQPMPDGAALQRVLGAKRVGPP